MTSLSVLSLIQLKRNSSTPSPMSNELDIQRKCLQERSQEGGGISLTAPALPAPALFLKTRDQDSCVSLGAPALPTCHQSPPPPAFLSIGLPFPQRHSPGPASFSCCHHRWPLRMKDLVPSSTMRRWVVNPRDSHPDVAMAGIYASVKEETLQVEGCVCSVEQTL